MIPAPVRGVFVSVVRARRFAFIREDGKERVSFVHADDLGPEEFEQIVEGETRVEFTEASTPKGLRATRVRVLWVGEAGAVGAPTGRAGPRAHGG